MAEGPHSSTFVVGSSSNRGKRAEPITQMNFEDFEDEFPQLESEKDFVVVKNPNAMWVDGGPESTEIHTQVQSVEEKRVSIGEVGLDFNLRFALGVAAAKDRPFGFASTPDEVEVDTIENPETKLTRRFLNHLFGTRVQVCRVRMAVQPDLENHICRLSKGTMDVLELHSGAKVCIEHPVVDSNEENRDGIVRGVKAFPIEEEIAEKKTRQQNILPSRYPSCEDLLGLKRIRKTGIDITTIYLDADIRRELGINDKKRKGVCQPVRVYRDNRYVLIETVHGLLFPLSIGVVGAAIGINDNDVLVILLTVALALILLRSILERKLVLH